MRRPAASQRASRDQPVSGIGVHAALDRRDDAEGAGPVAAVRDLEVGARPGREQEAGSGRLRDVVRLDRPGRGSPRSRPTPRRRTWHRRSGRRRAPRASAICVMQPTTYSCCPGRRLASSSRTTSTDSSFAASMKPQVLTSSTSASLGRRDGGVPRAAQRPLHPHGVDRVLGATERDEVIAHEPTG